MSVSDSPASFASSSTMSSATASSSVSDASRKLAKRHVLFLTPRWRYDHRDGVAALTHHLVENLRSVDPTGSLVKIYCLVAQLDQYISQEEKMEAKKDNVILLGARPPRGDESKPSTKWMDLYPSTYYSRTLEHLPQMTHIVGHLPDLPNGPNNIRDCIYKGDCSVKTLLINHKVPHTDEGGVDEDLVETWCKSADVVISVGHSMYDLTETILMDQDSDLKHDLYLPSCPVSFLKSNWLDEQKAREINRVRGSHYILICCPDREVSGGLDFETAVKAILKTVNLLDRPANPRGGATIALKLICSSRDQDQWKRDFYSLAETHLDLQPGSISLITQENGDKKKLLASMQKANLVIHPQDPESAYLGLDLLVAISVGVPVLVQEYSSTACLLNNLLPGNSSSVTKSDKNESEVDAWSRMIVERLQDQELAAEQAADIKQAFLRDTSFQRSHANFLRNILDPFHLEVNFTDGIVFSSDGAKLCRLFGVRLGPEEDDVSRVAALLSHVLHQREKTSVEAVHPLLVPPGGESVDDLMFKLVQGLEGDSRSVIEIRSQRPDNSDKPQLVFDIHCSNVADVLGLRDEISNNTDDVAKLLVKTVALVADFDRVAIRWKEPEHSCQVPELEDFVLHVSRKSATRNDGPKSQAPRRSRLPVKAKPALTSKPTYTALYAQRTAVAAAAADGRARPGVRKRLGPGDSEDEAWSVESDGTLSIPDSDRYTEM